MYITMSRRATTIPAKYSNGKLSFSPGPEFPGWPPLFLRAPVVGNAVNDVNINIAMTRYSISTAFHPSEDTGAVRAIIAAPPAEPTNCHLDVSFGRISVGYSAI